MTACTIRPAQESDARELSELRLQMDGETENLDREKGEDFIDEFRFRELISTDAKHSKRLFLVAVSDGKIIGYARCVGSELKRFSHRATFGISIRKSHWGYGIGKQLLSQSIAWSESNGFLKLMLYVIETNARAIHLYKLFDFEVEGRLKDDRMLSDGKLYDTILMGRIAPLRLSEK